MKHALLGLVCCLLAGGAVLAADAYKPDDKGFVRNWLILAPIPLDDGQSGAEGVKKQQIADEAKLRPKDGDNVTVGAKELAWKKAEASDYYFDVNALLGQQTENSVCYAVAYVTVDEEMSGLKLKVGSDDQVRVYLNGKELRLVEDARAIDKDQDTIENVTLKKGQNVLILKVVNEGEDWSGCARFSDKDDKPITALKVALNPE